MPPHRDLIISSLRELSARATLYSPSTSLDDTEHSITILDPDAISVSSPHRLTKLFRLGHRLDSSPLLSIA